MSTDKIKNVLGFGESLSSLAQLIHLIGAENKDLAILSLNEMDLFRKILLELKKFNFYLELITNEQVNEEDVESFKEYNRS